MHYFTLTVFGDDDTVISPFRREKLCLCKFVAKLKMSFLLSIKIFVLTVNLGN